MKDYSLKNYKLRLTENNKTKLANSTLQLYYQYETKLFKMGITDEEICNEPSKVIDLISACITPQTQIPIYGFLLNVSFGFDETTEEYKIAQKNARLMIKYNIHEDNSRKINFEDFALITLKANEIIQSPLKLSREYLNTKILSLVVKYIRPFTRDLYRLSFDKDSDLMLSFSEKTLTLKSIHNKNIIICVKVNQEFFDELSTIYYSINRDPLTYNKGLFITNHKSSCSQIYFNNLFHKNFGYRITQLVDYLID
jgi:hypothetical protein